MARPAKPARSAGDTIYGALALLNRSIPLADEFADGVQALENLRSGRATSMGDAWDLARAMSGAAADDFEREHRVGGQVVKGAGLAVQAVPFLAAPAGAVAARPGLIGSAARAAVAGGLGAQAAGLGSEGDLAERVQAANAATPASMAIGSALPFAGGMIGSAARAAQRGLGPRPVVRLSGEELAPVDAGRDELRRAAGEYYDGLRGSTVLDPDGEEIGFNAVGRKKFLSFSGMADKLRATPALPGVIGSGQVTSSGPPHKPVADHVRGFKTIEGPIAIGDAVVPMRVVVRRTDEGAHHYDHTVGDRPPPPPDDGGLLDRLLRALAVGQGASRADQRK